MGNTIIDSAVTALLAHSFRFVTEFDLQDGIAQILDGAGLVYEREKVIDKSNRFDFWLPSPEESARGTVIEVKIKGTLAQAMRQVDRYMRLPEVDGVVLATSTPWGKLLSMKDAAPFMPSWGGKPFEVVRIRRSL